MTLAERIARLYAGKYSTASKEFALPEEVDIVMKATHGATCNRLAHGSEAVAKEVGRLAKIYHPARVFFSTYSGNPVSANESGLTRNELPGAVDVGSIPTTSAEAIALARWLEENWISGLRGIVIVTDEFKSRRTRDIYQMFFPGTEIHVVALPIAVTYDPESPILNFRSMNRAIIWETLIPMVPFWIMTHSGEPGKLLMEWLSDRVSQAPAA